MLAFELSYLPPERNPFNKKQFTGKRLVWELQIKTLGWFRENETANSSEPLPYLDCLREYRDQDAPWVYEDQAPNWLSCGFKNKGIPFPVTDTNEVIWDFSVSSPEYDYAKYFKNQVKEDLFNGYKPSDGSQIHRYFSAGFVEPIWAWKDVSGFTWLHYDLFRLAAASDVILHKKPKATKPLPIAATACVGYPYGILMGHHRFVKITRTATNSFHISCTACMLTNCISNDLDKAFTVMILVKRPAYVLLPVDITGEEWFEDTGLETLRKLNELIRPKRFVAALILGISALIAIVTSFAVSTAALVKNVHTATFVNDMHKNISLVLAEQHLIDKKLETKINALEEVVLLLGQDVANLKTRMSTRCHASFKYICVTPAKYNASNDWDRTKAHLLGVWKDSNITYDLQALQEHISEMSKQKLDSYGLEELAQSLYSNMKSLNPLDWWHYIALGGAFLLVLILVLMIFPFLFRLILTSLYQTRRELVEIRLKHKKPGTATPASPSMLATAPV